LLRLFERRHLVNDGRRGWQWRHTFSIV
jgi:hypothetical protein